MQLKERNLMSVEILDRYNALLKQQEDELFVLLNKLLDFDRELMDSDEWRDVIHYRFQEEFIVPIQTTVHNVSNAINESRNALSSIKSQYQ